jgi:hypothetical protein
MAFGTERGPRKRYAAPREPTKLQPKKERKAMMPATDKKPLRKRPSGMKELGHRIFGC